MVYEQKNTAPKPIKKQLAYILLFITSTFLVICEKYILLSALNISGKLDRKNWNDKTVCSKFECSHIYLYYFWLTGRYLVPNPVSY